MTSSEPQQQPTPCPKIEVTKEHVWLQKFVGEWTYECECSMGPDQPAAKFSGTESVRAIGDVWVQGEGRGKMPDGDEATNFITLGFNPATQRFVGTFVSSMMTHLWVYDGSLDEAGNVLTLEAEGPDMTNPGKTSLYRDVVELVDDDHRVMRSQVPGENGTWVEFMTGHYWRKK
jgi:hypothetical protein